MKAIGHGGPESGVRLELPAPLIVLEALSRFISPQTIRSVLTQTGRHSRRIRRLPAAAVVWPVIAIGIWTDLDIPAIWRQVVGTLRFLFLVLEAKRPPSKSALSQARTRLGPCALRQLFVATSTPIDPQQLSFIHAVRVLRETAPLMRSAPTSRLPTLYAAMIKHIAQGHLPPRENRISPRVVKKKMSNFGKKRPEDYHRPQPQSPFEQSVVILK